jgi:hypothetical protein
MYNDSVLLPPCAAGFEPFDPWDVDAEILHVFGLGATNPSASSGWPGPIAVGIATRN